MSLVALQKPRTSNVDKEKLPFTRKKPRAGPGWVKEEEEKGIRSRRKDRKRRRIATYITCAPRSQ